MLQKNWSGSRNKTIKCILALIVQDPPTGNVSYTDTELKHSNQNQAVLDFVDFWKKGRGVSPKMLIFDSKFTTYKNLNILNQSKDKIMFLTLRRRGKNLIKMTNELPEDKWNKIRVERAKGKFQQVRVYDGICRLPNYIGDVRQVILTNHGHAEVEINFYYN